MSQRADLPRFGGRAGRGQAANPNLRVGDVERNEVAEVLSRHYSDGRLDAAEMKERLDKAMEAKTRADLSGLLSDLPPLGPEPSAPPRHHWAGGWVALMIVFIALWLPWQHGPWLWFPRVPWLVVGVVAWLLWRRSRRRDLRSQH